MLISFNLMTTKSSDKPLAMWGIKALKEGERKFWMNQNLTVLFVWRITETTMRKAIR